MKKGRVFQYGAFLFAAASVILGNGLFTAVSGAETICAEVKIEIRQELTLERQAFDAHMKINNGLTHLPLENVTVAVTFQDEDGNSILASSDPNNTDARFFIRGDSEGISENSNGAWQVEPVAPASSSDLHWLIIPAPGSAEGQEEGKIYYVGARLTYTLGGEEQLTRVSPDYIFVKPLPQIVLDYFLTKNVFGDDAFTDAIEAPVPFPLGVRVKNTGNNTAHDLKIDSAQPEIVENEQGLLIGFAIEGSRVNGAPAKDSLLVEFGDIEPGAAAVGTWIMTCTLSGVFTEFGAVVSHADELGGELTSLIKQEDVHTHFLVKDVWVDIPGRDAVTDFLARDSDALMVYESCGIDSEVANQSEDSSLDLLERSGSRFSYDVSTPAVPGFVYLKRPDPHNGRKVLSKVVRSDGKQIKESNAWLSRERKENPESGWNYFVNLFDDSTTGTYVFVFDDPEEGDMPPVLQFIPDKSRAEGEQLSFLLEASDPNGTVPALLASGLPAGASFIDNGDGSAIFDWTPQTGQAGTYTLVFRASDGRLEDQQSMTITIHSPEDTDGDGMPDAWERAHFGELGRDGTGDYDGDGITDLDEYLLGSDPTAPDHAPGIPQIQSPADGAATDSRAPALTISNSEDVDGDAIFYEYELYSDASYSDRVAHGENVSAGPGETAWPVPQPLADNTWYYWRVRASDGAARSLWSHGRFFVNTANDAPGDFQVSRPADGTEADNLTPRLEVTNSLDPDADPIVYSFEICSDAAMTVPVASVSGISGESGASTGWETNTALEDGQTYYWRATAIDAHGAAMATETASFLVNTANHAPAAPAIVSPSPEEAVNDRQVRLETSNSSDADGDTLFYYFELDRVSTFDSPDKQQSPEISEGIDTSAWDVTGLSEDTWYYWRVKASDGAADSPWTCGRFFVNTENNPPPVPVIKNPGKGAWVGTRWPQLAMHAPLHPEPEAVSYTFEVYSDANCQNRLIQNETGSPVFVPQAGLDNNSLYYWRVLAADEYGQSTGWTETAWFFVRQTGVLLSISGTPAASAEVGETYSFTPVVESTQGAGPLSFSITNRPAWAEFDSSTGTLSGNPGHADIGTTSQIVITVTASGGETASLTPFDLTVLNADASFSISGQPDKVVAADTAYSFTPVVESTQDAGPLSFSITNQPAWAEFDPSTGALTGTPAHSDIGTTSQIVITAAAENGEIASLEPFDLTVIGENDFPYISGQPEKVAVQETAYSFNPVAEAAQGAGPLTFSITNKPGWVEFDPTTGSLTGTPTADDLGTTTGIVITATDSRGDSASLGPFAIEVRSLSEAPMAVADSYSLQEDMPLLINAPGLLGNDIASSPDDNLAARLTADVSHGSLVLNPDGSFNYIPDTNYSGEDAFSYQAVEANVTTNNAAVSLSIAPVNDVPEISGIEDVSVMKGEGLPDLDFSIHDVETDPENLLVSVATDNPALFPEQNIALSGSGAERTLRLIPAENQNGRAAFTVTVQDPEGGTGTEIFTVKLIAEATGLNAIYLLLLGAD